MKLLVINGSPNKEQGGCHATTQVVVEEIRALLPDVSVETLFLRDLDQPYCDGCLSCLKRGHGQIDRQADRLSNQSW